MAKIFISYSQKDKRVVQQYARSFEKNNHQILMDETVLTPGDDMQKKLMEAQREADGTIVFITQNSTESPHVNSEIGLARSYKDKDGEFLITHVKGEVNVPYIIRDLNYIQIENKIVDEIIRVILDVIEKSSSSKKESPIYEQLSREGNMETKKRGRIYSKTEATEIQTTLRTLNIFNSAIDGVAGPATTKAIEGFQALYHLPVTGEWDEQTKKKAAEILKSRETKKETKQAPPAEEIKQEQPSSNLDPKYWLLKIYGDDWELGKLHEGSECYFNSHFNNFQPRPEYEEFKSVKKGELGFAYDYSSQRSILFSYEVTNPLHNDADRDEIFTFKITRFFDPVLPLTDFISLIGAASELQSDSLKKLFPITKNEYEA